MQYISTHQFSLWVNCLTSNNYVNRLVRDLLLFQWKLTKWDRQCRRMKTCQNRRRLEFKMKTTAGYLSSLGSFSLIFLTSYLLDSDSMQSLRKQHRHPVFKVLTGHLPGFKFLWVSEFNRSGHNCDWKVYESMGFLDPANDLKSAVSPWKAVCHFFYVTCIFSH